MRANNESLQRKHDQVQPKRKLCLYLDGHKNVALLSTASFVTIGVQQVVEQKAVLEAASTLYGQAAADIGTPHSEATPSGSVAAASPHQST
jgi:hypothetical protein